MNKNILLSDALRPKRLKDVIGQKHLIGENKILTNLVKNKKLFSIILYGKPGIGKTSIAVALSNELDYHYRMLNAAIDKKQDFDIAINEAKMYDGLILIVDEIHRMNKDKQDILLPYLENGLIILIGMTTSNPYHSINPAIRSRCQLLELKELSNDDIKEALKNASNSDILKDIVVEDDVYDYITSLSSHDLRYAYNLLEIAYYSSTNHIINKEVIKSICNKPNIYHDKNGDDYYDLLSGLQKSIRGSDVHASIYYLARLILAGDLDAICRRLSVIAYEDIGLANPIMGIKVDAAINASLRLGFPEARIVLSEVVIELALSPKSNSAVVSIDKALNDINMNGTSAMPSYLKSPYKDYKYPHNYPHSYVKQQYLPDDCINNKYYVPRDNKNENLLKQIMNKLEK